MTKQYYDRYQDYRFDNTVKTVPYLKIVQQTSDIFIEYNSKIRLDIVSNAYYGVPYYGWLIMQANPQYGGLEFDIPEGSPLRIPFPLMNALQAFQRETERYDTLYNINS